MAPVHTLRTMIAPLRCFLVVVVLLTSTSATIARTWTDTKGRTIEAEWVSLEGQAITLRLQGGNTVTFALSKLCEADQKLAKQLAGAARPPSPVRPDQPPAPAPQSDHPLGWGRLQITFIGASEAPRAIAMREALHRVGADTWSADLPAGCWIKVGGHLLKWKGEPRWFFRTAGDRLFRSTSQDGEWKVVGVSLYPPGSGRQTDETRAARAQELAKLGRIESVLIRRLPIDPESGIVSLDPVALSLPALTKPDPGVLAELSGVQAVSISEGQIRSLKALAALGSVECFDYDGASYSPVGGNIEALRQMTQLRYLEGSPFHNAATDGSELDSLINLEAISLRGRPQLGNPEFVTKLTKLHSIDLDGVSPKAVSSLPNLTRLDVRFPTMNYNDIDSLLQLKKLTALSTGSIDYLNEWRERGGLAHLRELNGLAGQPSELKGFRQLRHLHLYLHNRADAGEMGEVTQLETLTIFSATPEKLSNVLKNQKQLKALTIESSGDLPDLKALPAISSLRSLEIRRNTGLKSLEGISAAAADLEDLKIRTCDGLSDLQVLAKLKKLQKLELQLYGITALPLEGMEQLSALTLIKCGQLTELQQLSSLANLRYLNLRELPLTSIQGIGALIQLEKVALWDLAKLNDVAELARLSALNHLQIKVCSALSRQQLHDLKAALPNTICEGF